jgi:hypothetical protein
MNAPHDGRRRCCALAALLTGVLALTAPGAAGAQQTNGQNNGPSPLIGTADDLVNQFAQSLQQGNWKEARELDRALEDVLKAMKDASGNHKHHHHHHGAFGQGMGQFAGTTTDPQQQQQDPTSTSNSGTSGSSSSGKGSFGKGMSQFGRGGEEHHHHHHHGWFGKGMFGTGQAADSSSTGGTTEKIPSFGKSNSASQSSSTSSGQTAGKTVNSAARGAINNGVSIVNNNIRNVFNGPANVNVNNGQQQITQQLANAGATSQSGKSVGGKKTTATAAATVQTKQSKGLSGTTSAQGTGTSTPTTSNGGQVGNQLGGKTLASASGTAKSNGGRTGRTGGVGGVSASVKTSASAGASVKGGGTTFAAAAASAKSGNSPTLTKATSTAATGLAGSKNTTGKAFSTATASVGKMAGNGLTKQFNGAAAHKSGPTNFANFNRAPVQRQVGGSVGSRTTAAAAGRKR